MAVEIGELAAALRITDGGDPPEPERALLARLIDVGGELIEKDAPDAPAAVKDEALIRFAGYLYDAPTATAGDRYAAAWRNSGAASLLSRWTERRAGLRAEGVN